MEVLNLVAKILKEFKEVMPSKLPNELPLRKHIDSKFELLPGVNPPA